MKHIIPIQKLMNNWDNFIINYFVDEDDVDMNEEITTSLNLSWKSFLMFVILIPFGIYELLRQSLHFEKIKPECTDSSKNIRNDIQNKHHQIYNRDNYSYMVYEPNSDNYLEAKDDQTMPDNIIIENNKKLKQRIISFFMSQNAKKINIKKHIDREDE